MIHLDTARAFHDHIGRPFGPGDWHAVTQEEIDLFAAATGDRQWIHVDPQRAMAELEGGRTYAHGYLTLSLLPKLASRLWSVERFSRRVNAGSNRVRFITPVRSGDRIRLSAAPKSVTEIAGGVRMEWDNEVEVEGGARPALVAETIVLIYD